MSKRAPIVLFVYNRPNHTRKTPVEAMACGIPVVAFPCGVIPELVNDDNGVVCDDFTVESFVNGIKKILNMRFSPDVIRKNIIDRFSSEKIANDYINLYQKVLDNKQ